MVSPMWSYPMTATLDLAALKTLAEAATPGPWEQLAGDEGAALAALDAKP
jgi:hypothetical protein